MLCVHTHIYVILFFSVLTKVQQFSYIFSLQNMYIISIQKHGDKLSGHN
jgi:hypothetical protein